MIINRYIAKRQILSIIFAIIVCIGLSFKYSMEVKPMEPSPMDFTFLIVAILGYMIFYASIDKKLHKKLTTIIPALLFTVITLFANSLYFVGGLSYLVSSPSALAQTGFRFIAWYLLYYYAIKCFFLWTEGRLKPKISQLQYKEAGYRDDNSKKLEKFSNIFHNNFLLNLATFYKKHIILSTMLVILILELPYFILFYPGLMVGDGYIQLNQALGLAEQTNHHPILVTYFCGFVFKVGRALIDQSFGVFLFVLIQSLYAAFGWGVLVRYLKQLGVKTYVLVFTVAFFGLLPIFPNYATTFFKDHLWLTTFMLFSLQFLGLYLGARDSKFSLLQSKRLAYIIFGLTAFILPFVNNKGIVLVIPCVFILLFVKKLRKLPIALILVVCCGSSFLWNSYGLSALGVAKGSSGEMLPIAFQCTARYVKEHKEEISEEEARVILSVLKNESLQELADRYYPPNADFVKNTLVHPGKDGLLEYAKVWIKQGLRHPETYISAVLASTYGYLYPFISWANFNTYKMPSGVYYNSYDVNWAINDKQNYDVNFLFSDDAVQRGYKFMYAVESTPPFEFLYNPGLYFYIFVILLCLCIRQRRWKNLAIFMPAVANFGICLLSPVMGALDTPCCT